MAGFAAAPPTDDYVFLLGRPPISELIGFVRTMALDGQNVDQGGLATEWRGANDHLKGLQKNEAGVADNPTLHPLPASMQPFADQVAADPTFQQGYQSVPTRFSLLELDRLVVHQKFINLGFVGAIKASLPATLTEEDVARLAFGVGRAAPSVRFMQQGSNIYTAICPSNDFRFLEAKVIAPTQVQGLSSSGRPYASIVLTVGFGSNYLSAIEVEGRLLLHNGSHRAYALRDLGVTHAPFVLQSVSRREELDLVIGGDVQANPDRYLKEPRPPMLKDYFDAELRKVVPVPRKNRLVRVQYVVEQSDVPAT